MLKNKITVKKSYELNRTTNKSLNESPNVNFISTLSKLRKRYYVA